MAEITLTVVTDPVAKARARVAMRGTRIHAYTPAKTQQAEWRIREAFCAKFPHHVPWTGAIELVVQARIKMPASLAKKYRSTAIPITRPDCDNYLKTVLDSLNGVAFVDDSQVATVTFSKRYAPSDEPPSWFIRLSAHLMPESRQWSQQAVSHGDSAHAATERTGIRRVVG